MNQSQQIPGFGEIPPIPGAQEQQANAASIPGKPSLWWLGRIAMPLVLVAMAGLGVLTSVASHPVYTLEDPQMGTAANGLGIGLCLAALILVLPCLGLRANPWLTIGAALIAFVGFFAGSAIHGNALASNLPVISMPEFGAGSRPLIFILLAFLSLGGGILAAIDAYRTRPTNWGMWAACSLLLFFVLAPLVYIFSIYRPRLFPKGQEAPLLGVTCLTVSAGLGLFIGLGAMMLSFKPATESSAMATHNAMVQQPSTNPHISNGSTSASTSQAPARKPPSVDQYKRGPAATPNDFRVEGGVLEIMQTTNGLVMPQVIELTCRAETPIAITGFAINGKAIPKDQLIKLIGGDFTPYARGSIRLPVVMSIGDTLMLLVPRGGKQMIYFDIHTSRGSIRYQFQ
ncbi:MAG: hypothetical protein AAGK14_02165 [Verrucomicrobiota bacterium]